MGHNKLNEAEQAVAAKRSFASHGAELRSAATLLCRQSKLCSYITDMTMIDLHTHSLLSDGVLLPSELARRYEEKGYKALAITDHVDSSNVDYIVPGIVTACKKLNSVLRIKLIPGVELTHVPPKHFPELIRYARSGGIKLILIHGETIVEPVISGTNKKALECDIDILAHPGLISKELVKLAARKGIYLELTSRRGHCLTNGYVAKLACEVGARLILNSDAHSPEDIISIEQSKQVLQGAGLSETESKEVLNNSEELVKNILNADFRRCNADGRRRRCEERTK